MTYNDFNLHKNSWFSSFDAYYSNILNTNRMKKMFILNQLAIDEKIIRNVVHPMN